MTELSHVGMFTCYYCGDHGGLVLDRRLKQTLPRDVGVLDMNPCAKCEEYMQQGIILIAISDDTSAEDMQGPIPNPSRTGKFVVIKEASISRISMPEEHKAFAVKHRFMFITDAAWDAMGLPGVEDQAPC